MKKTIWFIRHAESLSNAGFPTDTPHAIGLSEKGLAQAEAVAAQWQTDPDLIVVSRYSRTAYTAVPEISHFSAACGIVATRRALTSW